MAKTLSPLTKEELSVPRTAAEMLGWALEAHSRFSASKELRDLGRSGKGYAKELAEEALPIARFAQHYFAGSREVVIRHVIGNQQYDAIVEDNRPVPGAIRYIEVTDATMDHNEALRNELLSRDGAAPGVGKIHAEGPPGRRTRLEGEYEMRNVGALPTQQLDRVNEAVKAKAAKIYPSGTALVVHVDDATAFRDAGAVAALKQLAINALVPLLSGREFRVLVLEGSNKLYEKFDLP
jgi:hypothetical protein